MNDETMLRHLAQVDMALAAAFVELALALEQSGALPEGESEAALERAAFRVAMAGDAPAFLATVRSLLRAAREKPAPG